MYSGTNTREPGEVDDEQGSKGFTPPPRPVQLNANSSTLHETPSGPRKISLSVMAKSAAAASAPASSGSNAGQRAGQPSAYYSQSHNGGDREHSEMHYNSTASPSKSVAALNIRGAAASSATTSSVPASIANPASIVNGINKSLTEMSGFSIKGRSSKPASQLEASSNGYADDIIHSSKKQNVSLPSHSNTTESSPPAKTHSKSSPLLPKRPTPSLAKPAPSLPNPKLPLRPMSRPASPVPSIPVDKDKGKGKEREDGEMEEGEDELDDAFPAPILSTGSQPLKKQSSLTGQVLWSDNHQSRTSLAENALVEGEDDRRLAGHGAAWRPNDHGNGDWGSDYHSPGYRHRDRDTYKERERGSERHRERHRDRSRSRDRDRHHRSSRRHNEDRDRGTDRQSKRRQLDEDREYHSTTKRRYRDDSDSDEYEHRYEKRRSSSRKKREKRRDGDTERDRDRDWDRDYNTDRSATPERKRHRVEQERARSREKEYDRDIDRSSDGDSLESRSPHRTRRRKASSPLSAPSSITEGYDAFHNEPGAPRHPNREAAAQPSALNTPSGLPPTSISVAGLPPRPHVKKMTSSLPQKPVEAAIIPPAVQIATPFFLPTLPSSSVSTSRYSTRPLTPEPLENEVVLPMDIDVKGEISPPLPSAGTLAPRFKFFGSSRLSDYELNEKIGEGTFGVVHKAVRKKGTVKAASKDELSRRHQRSCLRGGDVLMPESKVKEGDVVALKKIVMHNDMDGVPITAVREIRILKALNHPNVVPVIDMAFQSGKRSIQHCSETLCMF